MATRHFWHLGVAILGVAAICATIVIKSRHHYGVKTEQWSNKFNASRLFVAFWIKCWPWHSIILFANHLFIFRQEEKGETRCENVWYHLWNLTVYSDVRKELFKVSMHHLWITTGAEPSSGQFEHFNYVMLCAPRDIFFLLCCTFFAHFCMRFRESALLCTH